MFAVRTYGGEGLLDDRAVKRLEDDRDEIVALGAVLISTIEAKRRLKQSQVRLKEELLYDGPIECFEDNRDEVVTLGAFDLLESLDVVVLGAVHDREDLGNEAGFTAGPLARGTVIS